MFCPKCEAEFREGFSTCSDCDVALVAKLPKEPDPEYIEYEEILGTYNPGDIALIKSMLDSEHIVYYFLGEHFTYMRPLADPARLMVSKDDAEKAKDILKDLDLSYMGLNVDKGKK